MTVSEYPIAYAGAEDYTLFVLTDPDAVKRFEPQMSADYCNLDVSPGRWSPDGGCS